MEDARLAHGIALTLTRSQLFAEDAVGWLDVLDSLLGAAEDDAHVLPQVGNMIRVLQALYMFADRGVRPTWDRDGPVLTLGHRAAVKARIAEVLQLAMPYAA
jgi:hypothetical protein